MRQLVVTVLGKTWRTCEDKDQVPLNNEAPKTEGSFVLTSRHRTLVNII